MKNLRLLSILLVALVLWGCGTDDDTTPTPPAPTATIQGNVIDALDGVTTQQLAGITVSVQGTSLSTETDDNGDFTLAGVPVGDVVLLFSSVEINASLTVENVAGQQVISIDVSLSATVAVLTNIERDTEDFDFDLSNTNLTLDTDDDNDDVVTATVSGDDADIEEIDPDSLELTVESGSVTPTSTSIVDGQVIAAISVRSILDIVGNIEGSFELSLTFVADGNTVTVSVSITVEAPEVDDDDGDDDADDGDDDDDADDGDDDADDGDDDADDGDDDDDGDADDDDDGDDDDVDDAPAPFTEINVVLELDLDTGVIVVGNAVESYTVEITSTTTFLQSTDGGDTTIEVSLEAFTELIEAGAQVEVTGTLQNNVIVALSIVVYVDDFVDDEGDTIADDFDLDAQPDTWNTNYANNNSGSVSFKISAEGDSSVADIDQDSIEISIDGTATPSNIRRQGPNLRVILSKADAIALIDNPIVGEEYTAEVSFALEGGATITLTDTIDIVGPDVDDEDVDIVVDEEIDEDDVDEEEETITVGDNDVHIDEDTDIIVIDPETQETVNISISVFFQIVIQGNLNLDLDLLTTAEGTFALEIYLEFSIGDLPEDDDDADDEDFDVVDSDVSDVDDENDTFTVSDDDGEPVEVSVEEDTEIVAVDPETEETVMLSIDVFFQLLAQGDITVSVDFELDIDIAIAISIQISIDLDTLPEEIPDLDLDVDPDEWPLSWANSTDETFTATIDLDDMMDDMDDSTDDGVDDGVDDGTDDSMDDMDDMDDDSWLENVNLESFSLSIEGVEGSVIPNEVTISDGEIVALFNQFEVFSLLEEPAEDDDIIVVVSFEYGADAEVITLTDDVDIVAAVLPEFTASIDPTEWPLAAWETSEEEVTLELLSSETEGINLVDLSTVTLSVLLDEGDPEDDSDDAFTDALEPVDVSTDEDMTLTALFAEADLFGAFDVLPEVDSVLTLKVNVALTDGTELELFLDATIIEPVVAPAIVVSESELVTDETGVEATFSVSLATEPTEPVTVTLTTDEEEGVDPEVALSVETLEFDTTNWDVPVDVTVTGQDDEDADGDVTVTVTLTAASNDADYEGLSKDVSVINEDDEPAPEPAIVVSESELVTDETFATATFDVTLATQPAEPVTLTLTYEPDDEGEVSPFELTFDADNWDVPQTVEVQGTDDDEVDGDISYDLVLEATSNDLDYDGKTATVTVTNEDDDVAPEPTPAINVSATELVTNEDLTVATFDVTLATQPAEPVTLTLTYDPDDEGEVSPFELTFDADNWDVPQTVEVQGTDDDEVDGDISYDLVLEATSNDLDYDGKTATVTVTNQDND